MQKSNQGSVSASPALSGYPAGIAAVAAAVLCVATSRVPAALYTAGVSDVSSVQTQLTEGLTTLVPRVNGSATPNSYSGFTAGRNYNISYGSADDKVVTVTAGGVTYTASGMATNVTRRVVSPYNNDQLWFKGLGTAASPDLSLAGPYMTGFSQAFESNNLYVGADNLFANSGNAVGNNSNVVRLDMNFGSLIASPNSAFAIFDRGAGNDHDAFKIAAITAIDSGGNPTAYGTPLSFADGSWGKTDVVAAQEELILRKNNSTGSDTLHPSDYTDQAIGGVTITTAALAPAGSTIYGYSLFSGDAPSSGTALVNYTGLQLADSTSHGGGLDPAATVAVLYTVTPVAVPEPASLAMAAVICSAWLGRRGKKRPI